MPVMPNSSLSLTTAPLSSLPERFPLRWASAWGEDEYGLWMTLELAEAQQRFRWIAPGRFRMGSPEDEPERERQ
jgi:sulfatase modifying factor 1